MRNLWCLVILLLSAATVHAQPEAKLNTLTPAEKAQGKVLVFDGKTTSGWIIDGDAKVKDGVLILGGSQKTRVRIETEMSPQFELHLEYSTANTQNIQLELHSRHSFFGRGMSSSALARTSKKQGEWIEAIYGGKDAPAGRGWEGSSKWRVLGDPAFTEQPVGGSSLPHSVTLVFDIPAGQKLYLRNVRLKTDPVDSFPWLLVLAVGAVVLVLIIAVLVVVIKRRRTTQAPA
jgi:hypothetical protein